LAAAHQAGIVHRDIKPGNLLLADGGQVKVADFGIVRILDETTTTLTATGQIVGTSHYLSPERALGKPAEGPSDVYALGCVLYQLVTGHPPFMAQDPASIMYQHVETTPTPPSDLRPELAGEFEALLFWLLAKDPAQRPTAAQVAQGATPPVVVQGDTTPQKAITEQTALLIRPGRSRKTLAVAAATLALALGAATGILLTTNTNQLPATNDLKTEPSAVTPTPSNPVPKPSTTPSVRTTATSRTTTARQTSGPKNPSADPDPAKPGKAHTPGRPGTKKPKKPKA
jgi:serine/threonine-protein kinase